MNLFELTKTLVNIPSVTGSEGKIADFLGRYLKGQGFALLEQKVLEGRKNLLATLASKPRVILCTHLDTVPPYFEASEDEDYIYGRGACDAKGIMASMIWAAQELKKDGVTEIGLLLVVGEETDSIGAQMAGDLNVGSEFLIVGEPTENKLGLGHKGMITLKITAYGKKAHSAYPHLGESAVEKLLDILQEIRHLNFPEDPMLGKTTRNIGIIEGGIAPNIIADRASAVVSFRTTLASGRIMEKVRTVTGEKAETEILTQSEPQKLFTVPEFENIMLPYGTDIPFLKSFGRPMLIGPGSVLVAHTEDEKIEKRQLSQAVEIYKKLIKILLAKS